MQELVELTYIITIMIGVMSFTMQIMASGKNLAVSNDMAKSKSLTGFLAIIVAFNICDFLIIFFSGIAGEGAVAWIYVLENILEVALAYQLIVLKANLAKEEKNPWAATYFALVAVVILMIDVFYTTKMITLSEMAYLVIMIGLNILPLGAVAYFNIRYVRMIEGFKTRIVTRVYLGIYNVAFIFLCFVSTLSMVDERTTYDYFANDKAIYAIFWLVFNTLSAVFVWSSCRTVDSNVDCVGNSTDLLLEKAADKFALSTREREIARLLYDGKNNNEIADVLFLSTNTIKVHTSNLYKKLGASNRVQAIKIISGEEI